MLVDRQRAPCDGGGAGVGVRPVQHQRARPGLDEPASPADGSAERGAVAVTTGRQGKTAQIDPSTASDRPQRAVHSQLKQSPCADGQGCTAGQAAGDEQGATRHIGGALVDVATTEGQLTQS